MKRCLFKQYYLLSRVTFLKHDRGVRTIKILYILLLLLLMNNSYSQPVTPIHGRELQPTFSFKEYALIKYQEDFGSLNKSLPAGNTEYTYSENTLKLDSIIEISNLGQKIHTYKWFCNYDDRHRLTSVERKMFNENGEFLFIQEIDYYNTDGEHIKYIMKKPYIIEWELNANLADSLIIDYVVENYYYQKGMLVKKEIISNEHYDPYWADYTPDTITHYYRYNERGDLLVDSIDYYAGSNSIHQYYYDAQSRIKFQTESLVNWGIISVTRYNYTETDSSLKTDKFFNHFYEPVSEIDFDTLTQYLFRSEYLETFDTEGRRINLRSSRSDSGDSLINDFFAEYSYTERDEINTAIYYRWDKSDEEGVWKESIRVSNTWDEQGFLHLHEKTFFDDRTQQWLIDNRKEYYYTQYPAWVSLDNLIGYNLVLFPNPVQSELHFNPLPEGAASFSIFDISGHKVYQGRLQANAIEVNNLCSGVYIIFINTATLQYSGRFIKN